ncbi:hypothetical protein SUGI_0079630 [Cryptomeria japonica]|nr:hypothetical protein SUGI_0079630 [Cryptomeria japonica]
MATLQQSNITDLELHASSQSEIQQGFARFSNGQLPPEYCMNRGYHGDILSHSLRRLSFPEREIPSSGNTKTVEFLSFDYRYIHKQGSLLPIDSTEKQSNTVDLPPHASLQCEIERASSRFSDGQLPPEICMHRFEDDESLSNSLHRLSFLERQIPFSWPLSPQAKKKILVAPSLDYPYTRKRCLRNQQHQQASERKEKVPFLLRLHSGHFHICLGLCSQTVLWKTLDGDSTSFIRLTFKLPSHFTLVLWLLALISFLLISGAYILKCFFYLETVRREYCDRVRVNYLFVPLIAGMLLRMGLPSDIAPDKVNPIMCCMFMAPIVVMEVKIYGQWFTRGKRSLARIANPSTYLSVIGNFVVARLATTVDWNEIAMFFFTVGLVHYAIVFITLYQRFSPDITVSRKITPLFFLFIAGPSSASVTWQGISGSFDTIVRINLFQDTMQNFSVIWWACAYPMTITSVATIKYAEEEPPFS